MSDGYDITEISRRITALELCLGLNGEYDTSSTSERVHVPADFSSRIDRLHSDLDILFSSNDTLHFSLQSELDSCENLAKTLCPSGLLLASSNNPTDVSEGPLFYRRQEILARWEDLQYALHTLAEIRDLMLRSYPQLTKALQENQQRQQSAAAANAYPSNIQQLILSAPIISSATFDFASESKNIDRLFMVTQRFSELDERVNNLTQRADDLIERYYSIMSIVNDKFTLAIEDLNQKSIDSRQSPR